MKHDSTWDTIVTALWMAAFLTIFAYALAGLWAT